jgi:hypothetical protein
MDFKIMVHRKIIGLISALLLNWSSAFGNNPCDNPFSAVEIKGIVYSGNLRVTQDELLSLNERYKKILYDKTLKDEDKWKRIDNVRHRLNHYYTLIKYCNEQDIKYSNKEEAKAE